MTEPAVRAEYRTHQLAMVVLAAVAFFASAPGQSFLISVFVDDLLEGTGLSRTTFSVLYAAGTVVSAGSMLALGRIVDRRGLRVAWVAVTLALAAACGLTSLATGAVVAFFALAALRTFGQGSFPLVGTLLVARSFERSRGKAMAAATLGITAASIVLPPAVAALILAVGWRHAYQLIALALLVLVLPLAILVRLGPARPGHPAGQDPTSAAYPSATRTLRGRFTIPSRRAGQMLFILAAPPLVATALTFHAVSILGERQLSFLQAGVVLSVLGMTAGAGTILSGLLADRLTPRTLLTVLSLTILAAPLTLLIPHPVAAYASFGILGLAMGSTGVANGTLWARLYGTAALGRIQGTAQSSMISAAAVAPLIPAVSHGVTGGYDASLVALALVAAATTVTAIRWRAP